MKAIVYHKSGSGDVLKLEGIEKPVPADDEVLIKVRAASVNPLDYHLLRHAFLRRVMSAVSKVKITRPGRDVAGVISRGVEAVGRNVTQFKAGDEVSGACNGAFAEYACARESALARKPTNVSFEQAASVPVAGLIRIVDCQFPIADWRVTDRSIGNRKLAIGNVRYVRRTDREGVWR